jgi:hypothetical protein
MLRNTSSIVVRGDSIVAFARALSRSNGNLYVAAASIGLDFPDLSSATADGLLDIAGATLLLVTKDVPPTSCFEHLSLSFHRTAGENEAELRRRLLVRDSTLLFGHGTGALCARHPYFALLLLLLFCCY